MIGVKPRTDAERLAWYDALVRTLAANCPMGGKPSPHKVTLWKRAYNTLFMVEAGRKAR